MNKEIVYFASLRNPEDSPIKKLSKFVSVVDLEESVHPDDIVAVKTHMG